jgi:hypothetical protein
LVAVLLLAGVQQFTRKWVMARSANNAVVPRATNDVFYQQRGAEFLYF